MFSFITRFFKKKDENLKIEETVSEEIPYTLDFAGAKAIEVMAEDCTRENVNSIGRRIVRPEYVDKIIELLAKLPTEGTEEMNILPCKEHTLIAHDIDDKPFAQVMFYKRKLKLENGLFIETNSRAEAKQEVLYQLIETRPAVHQEKF